MDKKKKKKPPQTRKQRNEQYQKNTLTRELKPTEDALVRTLCCLHPPPSGKGPPGAFQPGVQSSCLVLWTSPPRASSLGPRVCVCALEPQARLLTGPGLPAGSGGTGCVSGGRGWFRVAGCRGSGPVQAEDPWVAPFQAFSSLLRPHRTLCFLTPK